jgi:hypothetical protein
MTKLEFMAQCEERCIDPSIALENDDIVQALKEKDDSKVVELLDTQF